MAGTKLVVIYPRPADVDAFERAYRDEHVPLAVEKIKGTTKFVATRVVGTPGSATPPFYRIAQLHFRPPSAAMLTCCRLLMVSAKRGLSAEERGPPKLSGDHLE